MPFVLRQLHGYRAAQCCDLHGVSFAVFDVVASKALVVLFADPNGREHLAVISHRASRPGVPGADGDFPHALRPLKDQNRV